MVDIYVAGFIVVVLEKRMLKSCVSVWYGVAVDDTVEDNAGIFSVVQMRWNAGACSQ